jgi:transposase
MVPDTKRDRNFVDAVVWIARTGTPWRDLDSQFGPWKTIYNRFRNWSRRGWWQDIFRGTEIKEGVGSILDASIIRAHQDAAGGYGGTSSNALGRSRGGFSTKLHAIVSMGGWPIELRLTPGQTHEMTVAETLLDFARGEHCLADGAYDADSFLEAIRAREMKPVIPPHKRRRTKRRLPKELYGSR